MSGPSLTIEQVLTLLSAAPPRLAALTAGLSEDTLHISPANDEWSANDVLAHLRSCADVWGDYMLTILKEDRPTLRAVNPATWIKQTNYLQLAFQPSLHAFSTQRAELLAILSPLPHEAWSRTATVTGADKVLEKTILSYAQRLAIHERPHIKQIERIVRSIHLQHSKET